MKKSFIRKIVIEFFKLIGLIAVIVIAANWFYYRFVIMPELKNRTEVDQKYLPLFIADHKDLASTYLIGTFGTKYDAGEFLNSRIVWTGGNGAGSGVLNLPASLQEKFRIWGVNWIDKGGEIPWQQIDLTWMSQLSKYDHWDLHRYCNACDSQVFTLGLTEHKRPNYIVLQIWAKLRLLRGIQEGKNDESAQEVRHLARLISSQELILGEMTALTIYKYERLIYDYLKSLSGNVSAGWNPVSLAQLERAKRACYALSYSFFTMHSESFLKEVFANNGPKYCRCAAFSYSIPLGGLLGKKVRETAFPEKESLMSQLLAGASDCRLHPYREIWLNENQALKGLNHSAFILFEFIKWLPSPVRALYGRYMSFHSAGNPWEYYQNPAN